MSLKFLLLTVFIGILVCAGLVPAQDEGVIPVYIEKAPDSLLPGAEGELRVIFDTPPGHHITPLELGLFFVEITVPRGFKFSPPVFPQPVIFKGEKVFQGRTSVTAAFKVEENIPPGEYKNGVSYGYQICAETGSRVCFFPQTGETIVSLIIAASASNALSIDSSTLQLEATSSDSGFTGESLTLADRFTRALNRGSALAFLLVFLAGILTSFTPCVYPVIPITVGYVGGRAEGKKLKGFILSIFLVLGLATVYSILGVAAAATGSVFGSLAQHPAVLVVVALIFAAMGASMLGLFDITIPASLQNRMQTRRKGFLGAYLVGMVTGIVAAPCVGPVLVALLTWVAQTGNLLQGFLLLFTFAIGMGLLFIVIGTFASAVSALPGSGQWMVAIKKGFGVILLGGAIFFLKPLVSEGLYHLSWGILLVCAGVFLGALNFTNEGQKWSKALGILLLLAGIIFFISGFKAVFRFDAVQRTATVNTESAAGLPWIVNDAEKAFTRAQLTGNPLMMDFYADWCAACRELEEFTWSDARFISAAENLILLKIDLTRPSAETKALQDSLGVKGLPTVIFFSSEGEEISRFSGFRPAEAVVKIVESL